MTLYDFTARVPASVRFKVSAATLRVWHCIYCYVTEYGQTDRFDRALDEAIAASLEKWISDATLQRHLRRMATAGLLQGHRVVVRYTEFGKVWLPFGRIFRNDALSAGAFIRYTLPGMTPTLDIKKDDELSKKV